MRPITYYYSSRVNPIPSDTEKWLENLPAILKVKLAKALLCQIDDTFMGGSTDQTRYITFEEKQP